MSKSNNKNAMVQAMLPRWLQMMRDAAMGAISKEDVKEIVTNQVKRAKAGDQNAIRFVFDQVLGGAQLKGATFIQNVYEGGERPDRPTKARPGTGKKLDTMARRASAGLPLCSGDDGPDDIDLL